MPRSFRFNSSWRLCLLALSLMVPVYVVGNLASAQRRRPAQPRNAATLPDASAQQKKNLTRVNSSDTSEGSSITIFSDLPLNDYAAYRGGDRFYVSIPAADASRIASGLRGRGFTDVRVQKRGDDVLLSFRLLAGATARVSQKFNRLEILISVPALVAANAAASNNASYANNSNAGTQSSPSGSTGNASSTNTGRRTQPGSGSSSRNSTGNYNPNSVTTPGDASTGQNTIAANPNVTNPPDGIPVGPDGRSVQPGTSEFPTGVEPVPVATPYATPPVDQIAQLQPTPGIPGTITQAPPDTATSAPSSGTTFGAQIKQNWLLILLAVAVAGLIAWVMIARSRADHIADEGGIETIREASAPSTAVAPEPRPAVPSSAPSVPAVESRPDVREPEPIGGEDLIVPAVVAVGVAGVMRDEPVQEAIQATEMEPVKPVVVEQASEDVASLLAGNRYDEASISTQHSEARQIVAAELLAALAGRNIIRQERAREAFVKHGYFDDATRTLRTAESPGERASAARSLGLVLDESGTPHLVAALEDPSPEVRRAAVESLAEVRDPSAVASLEALRDREKSRRVPSTLIQHAIEASVVGRKKDETTTSTAQGSIKTPLTDADSLPVVSESPAVVEVPATDASPALVSAEPTSQTPEWDQFLFETREAAEETEPLAVDATELASRESQASLVDDIPLDIPQSVEVTGSAPATELSDKSSDDWFKLDLSRSTGLSHAEIPEVNRSEPADEVVLGDSHAERVAPEMTTAADDVTPESVADITRSALPIEAMKFGITPQASEPASFVEERESDVKDDKAITIAGVTEKEFAVAGIADKEIAVATDEHSGVPAAIMRRLESEDVSEREGAIDELGNIGGDDAFREVSAAFDDPEPDVRNAAARALVNLNPDRAGSFTRALREASPTRRRHIGAALSASGLATEAIGNLMGESREKTYDAFSLLFLMSKTGEVQPLMRAVEEHPNNEVRLAVVKLLALSGQQEILPAFRRLAVRGSLPTEVRSAVMEAIYQISSQSSGAAT